MKKFLALTLTLTLCMVLCLAAFPGLSASAAENSTYTMTEVYDNGNYSLVLQRLDTITVATAEELRYLSEAVNAGKLPVVVVSLLADITLNEGTFDAAGKWSESGEPVAFTPIGNSAKTPFTGYFLGNGHTIYGLYVTGGTYCGLFGRANGYRVQDLHIQNAYVFGSNYVGSVMGMATWRADLKNVTVSNAHISGKDYVGGVVGFARYDQDPGSKFYGVSFNGTVSGSGNGVGGIVGGTSGASIRNVSATGTMKGVDGVGGIIGISNGDVSVVNAYSAAETVASGNGAGGIAGSFKNGSLANCLATGSNTAAAHAGSLVGISTGDFTVTSCYYKAGSAAGVEGATAVNATDLSGFALVNIMNTYLLSADSTAETYFAWTVTDGAVRLSDTLPVARITAGGKTFIAAGLGDAAYIARCNENATVKLLRGFTSGAAEIGGNYTLDLSGQTVKLTAPLTVSVGTLTLTDATGKGSLRSSDSAVIILNGGSLKVNAGTIRSESSYALQNNATGEIYLSGKPTVAGGNGVDIYTGYANTLYGCDGAETPASYEGNTIRVACGFNAVEDAVVVKNAPEGKFSLRNYSNKYTFSVKDGSLVFEKIAFGAWWFVGGLFVAAAALLVITLVRTARYKTRMKNYSVVPFLPLLFFTVRQFSFLIAAGAAFLICLAALIITSIHQKKKEEEAKNAKRELPAKEEPKKEEPKKEEPAEEKAVEEAPAEEETVEEAPTEEETVEEAPAEEETVEEAPAEEETVEEAPAEEETVEEAPAEEETVEEAPAEEETEDETAAEAPAAAAIGTVSAVRGDNLMIAEVDAAGATIYSLYKKSFSARLIQSDVEIQQRYEAVKNALLSYKKVSSRVSWSYDSFKSGRKQLAKITIRGKTPYLYLALDPAALDGSKYNVTDAGKAKKYSTVPCRLRLTSKRSVKWAIELVEKLAEQEGLVPNPKFKPASYVSENETTEALIEKGLIKKAQ